MMRSAIAISLPRFNHLPAQRELDFWVDVDGRGYFLSVTDVGQQGLLLAEKQEHR
ncbi:hypothetical protein [Pseudomonas sp. FME51]|uniref:hypothetical protein n=1 Tax=Pseudomonas sp. FME51 TaxID=2742609 RepID=UPI0018690018|nr:hypothetical protein [Pseudomonas sp. FME51]